MTDVSTTPAVHTITAEVVTAAGFAPFGTVLGPDGVEARTTAMYAGITLYSPGAIQADTDLEWLFTRTDVREFRLLYLERHMLLGQAFIPVGGDPFLLVVAPADAREEDGFPVFDDIRAFIVPGNRGVQVDAGVWHEPPFGLVDGSCQLLTSHRKLTQGLHEGLNRNREIAQLDVEKRNLTDRTGKILKITLP